jgi:4-amino-4-deoxy-L-arabinose transferase-like glycosyltransferase
MKHAFALARSRAAQPSIRPATVSLQTQLALLLMMHVLVWAWAGYASRSNFDVPGDMVEAYVWSQGWQWGYFKHPPLSAWVAGLWFAVVPESHLAYSLLAAVNSGIGLAGLALLAAEFVPRRWVLMVVALAALAPGFTSLAMRFNANAVLVSTWPWAIVLFVRLMQHGRMRDALLCGVVCALAILGKYFSAVLLLALLATALWRPTWRARMTSGPVLLALTTFGLCLLPHILWLSAQTVGPLQYARAASGVQGQGQSLARALNFALAQAASPLLALLILRLALVGPHSWRAFFAAATAPLRPSPHPVWLLAVLPIVATMGVTVATGARTASVWGLAMAAGLALLAAHRAAAAGATLSLRRLWCCLAVAWVLIAAGAPLWWHSRAAVHTPAAAEPRAELAHLLSKLWQQEEGKPLPWVAGTPVLAASTAFYAPEHPRYWSLWNPRLETPWVDLSRVADEGGFIVCAAADSACHTLANTWSADVRWVGVAKSERGHAFKPQRFAVWRIAPAATQPSHASHE